jgi:hypothetical protein
MLSVDSVCKPHPDVVYQLAGDEAVLVLPRAGQIKVLNEVGTFIWTMLDGKLSVGEVVGEICQEYRVDPEQSQADALEFLIDLQARGIVQVIIR